MRASVRLGVVIGCLSVVGCMTSGCSTNPASTSTGDPGGRIVAILLTIRHAVPPGSSEVRAFGVQEPRWISKCSDEYLHRGWSTAQAQVSFISSQSLQAISRYVNDQLSVDGWHLTSSSGGQWYGPAGSVSPVLLNNHVEFGKRTAGPASHAILTLNWGTPVTGFTVGQPVTWILVASSLPVPPVGSCSGG